MNKKIAICVDSDPYLENRIFDPELAKKYPGAEGVSVLAQLAEHDGRTIVTGDVALSKVSNGDWNPEDVIVVQDMDSNYGLQLLDRGADPRVLIAMESPIFAHRFYDNLVQTGPIFKHRILFGDAFKLFDGSHGHNHQVYFPIFHKGHLPPIVPWNQKKFIALVAGNKHYKATADFPRTLRLSRYKRWYRKYLEIKSSPSLTLAIKNELQTKRLEAVEFFGAQEKLDVFGTQWDNPKRMTAEWQKKLKLILAQIKPIPCDDKVDTLSGYKFSICFENTSYPGYVTEKIIDCLVAGTIPIYIGAPDIDDFVPAEAFIDMRKFKSWVDLDDYINIITEQQAAEMITAGRGFLNSEQGARHTFEAYAETVFDYIKY
jgi:hypothetical protein